MRTEKLHVGAVNLLALAFGRVRAGDVESSILHKVEIGVSAAWNFSAMIAHISLASVLHCSREIDVMARSAKTIATLASVALLACSIFVVSWIGLALLGY